MTRTSNLRLWVLALGLFACREAPIETKPTPTLTVVKADEALAALPAPDPAIARMPLSDRLALEASLRPAEAVRTEQLERALRPHGVSLMRQRQVLASTLGASYCELTVSEAGLGVALCEFVDAASATAGGARSRALFDSMVPGRTLVTRANTLLTVTHPESDAARREAELILTTFDALSPGSVQTTTAQAR
ncbi:MAG: hypothetical protein JWN04_6122 [Myxococcaceae bacterium]|nr:hypothetical protein [Myxococcaceae bacterium]